MWQLIVLGIVQGLTEFLPVSSSGHLVLLEHFFGIEHDQLAVTVGLHLGTLVATCVVYWREIIQILRGDWRLALVLVLAMIPAGVIGLTYRSSIETAFSNIQAIGYLFWITAAALFLGERLFRSTAVVREQVTWRDAVVIGVAQAIAILPGVSRSGMTISAGLACGLKRSAAAWFSFLLAIPVVAGAVLVEGYHAARHGEFSVDPWAMAAGIVVSFIVGLAALKGLLLLLARYPMYVFGVYCFLLGAGVLAYQFGGKNSQIKPLPDARHSSGNGVAPGGGVPCPSRTYLARSSAYFSGVISSGVVTPPATDSRKYFSKNGRHQPHPVPAPPHSLI